MIFRDWDCESLVISGNQIRLETLKYIVDGKCAKFVSEAPIVDLPMSQTQS